MKRWLHFRSYGNFVLFANKRCQIIPLSNKLITIMGGKWWGMWQFLLAMGLKSKYLLRLSHLKSTRLNLVMLGQKKILASYFLPLLSMHLVLNFPNFPVWRLFKWSDNWSFLWLAYLQLFPNLSNRSHTNFLSLLSTCFLSLCLFSHFLGTVSLQRSQVTCSPFR